MIFFTFGFQNFTKFFKISNSDFIIFRLAEWVNFEYFNPFDMDKGPLRGFHPTLSYYALALMALFKLW